MRQSTELTLAAMTLTLSVKSYEVKVRMIKRMQRLDYY